MKTSSKIQTALLVVVTLFIVSCDTFMPSNIIDESNKIKSWLTEAGYFPKSNGYNIYVEDFHGMPATLIKSYQFGNADDRIINGSQLAHRIKPVNDKVRFECTVDIVNDYYYLRLWKSYLKKVLSETGNIPVEDWAAPFISESYLKIDRTDKDNFLLVVNSIEGDFPMDYEDFKEYYNQKLEELKEKLEEEKEQAKQDSLSSESF